MGETAVATRTPLKSVYVAAELCAQQGKTENFLRGMRRYLGKTASMRALSEAHMTFLESRGVKECCYDLEYTNHDVLGFQERLQRFLENRGYNRRMTVRMNREAPLRWAGSFHKIALNILPDGPLDERRAGIEAFLVGQFGTLPDLTPFEPHVTIGRIDMTKLPAEVVDDARHDANELLLPGLVVPSVVLLEGLSTYLSRIHPPFRPALARTG